MSTLMGLTFRQLYSLAMNENEAFDPEVQEEVRQMTAALDRAIELLPRDRLRNAKEFPLVEYFDFVLPDGRPLYSARANDKTLSHMMQRTWWVNGWSVQDEDGRFIGDLSVTLTRIGKWIVYYEPTGGARPAKGHSVIAYEAESALDLIAVIVQITPDGSSVLSCLNGPTQDFLRDTVSGLAMLAANSSEVQMKDALAMHAVATRLTDLAR